MIKKQDKFKRNELLNTNSWIWIFPIVSILFWITPYSNLEWFNSFITQNSLIELIKERTSNIIALISISFAIIGFIMGNIANKDDFIYKILFKRTMLFPTLYLGISIIVCFIILSSICTSLNYNYLATTLLIGTLLIILFIFFLGRMFKFLGVFLRPHTIRQYVQRELHKELEKASRSNLKIGVWLKDYFKLKEGSDDNFQTISFLRRSILKSIDQNDEDALTDNLRIIQSSYLYQKVNHKDTDVFNYQIGDSINYIIVLNDQILKDLIIQAIKHALLKNSTLGLRSIYRFTLELRGQSISKEQSQTIFLTHYELSFLLVQNFYRLYTVYRSNYSLLEEVKEICSEDTIENIIRSYQVFSIPLFDSTKYTDREIIELKYFYFNNVSEILYLFIGSNDTQLFENAIQELNNQIPFSVKYNSIDITDDFDVANSKSCLHKLEESLIIRTLFFKLKYWLFFLRESNQPINKELLLVYHKSINIVFLEEAQSLEEFIWMCSNQFPSYNSNWDYRKIKSGTIYTPITEIDWYIDGFVYKLIMSEKYIDIRIHKNIEIILGSNYKLDFVKYIIGEIKSKFDFYSNFPDYSYYNYEINKKHFDKLNESLTQQE